MIAETVTKEISVEDINLTRAISDMTARFGNNPVETVSSNSLFGPNDALEMLALLRTADQLAAWFQMMNIKGSKNILEQCPIARWATTNLPGISAIQVDNTGLTFVKGSTHYRCDNPILKEFVRNFDNGKYPQLEA